MVSRIEIENLHCLCANSGCKGKIAYILYPMDILSGWIEQTAEKYNTTIVVITGMDWQDVFSPWPAKGVPNGCPDFKGEAPEFLNLLQTKLIPKIEDTMQLEAPERTLVGVSMSGLFALWQWVLCDTFTNISSLSGSFWYEGFADWIGAQKILEKRGKAFFLLGNQEVRSKVKAFATVAEDTDRIITFLDKNGIKTEFQSVPGNHYANPIPRLNAAFSALYFDTHRE